MKRQSIADKRGQNIQSVLRCLITPRLLSEFGHTKLSLQKEIRYFYGKVTATGVLLLDGLSAACRIGLRTEARLSRPDQLATRAVNEKGRQ